MLERILNFLKNKYFIGTVVLYYIDFVVTSVINYYIIKKLMKLNLKNLSK